MSIDILAVRLSGPTFFEPSIEALPELLLDEDVYVWVSLRGRDPDAAPLLEETFGLHPLVVEDAFSTANMPKLEDHGDYLYIIVHGLRPGVEHEGQVEMVDVDVFLGARFVVTHEERELPSLVAVRALVAKDPTVLAEGPASVVHEIFDRMIDRFLPLMDRLDREVDGLEFAILRGGHKGAIEQIFELKHSLGRLRRISLHQRDVLVRLSSSGLRLVPAEQRPFFRDVYDHFLRVIGQTEGYVEMVSSSLDAHLAIQSHRMNEIMKVLTLISTVMLPLNFIAGVYGMNFDYMPGLHWRYGYPAAWLVMCVTAAAMYTFFRRRRWI